MLFAFCSGYGLYEENKRPKWNFIICSGPGPRPEQTIKFCSFASVMAGPKQINWVQKIKKRVSNLINYFPPSLSLTLPFTHIIQWWPVFLISQLTILILLQVSSRSILVYFFAFSFFNFYLVILFFSFLCLSINRRG